jgi:hypothetical protein
MNTRKKGFGASLRQYVSYLSFATVAVVAGATFLPSYKVAAQQVTTTQFQQQNNMPTAFILRPNANNPTPGNTWQTDVPKRTAEYWGDRAQHSKEVDYDVIDGEKHFYTISQTAKQNFVDSLELTSYQYVTGIPKAIRDAIQQNIDGVSIGSEDDPRPAQLRHASLLRSNNINIGWGAEFDGSTINMNFRDCRFLLKEKTKPVKPETIRYDPNGGTPFVKEFCDGPMTTDQKMDNKATAETLNEVVGALATDGYPQFDVNYMKKGAYLDPVTVIEPLQPIFLEEMFSNPHYARQFIPELQDYQDRVNIFAGGDEVKYQKLQEFGAIIPNFHKLLIDPSSANFLSSNFTDWCGAGPRSKVAFYNLEKRKKGIHSGVVYIPNAWTKQIENPEYVIASIYNTYASVQRRSLSNLQQTLESKIRTIEADKNYQAQTGDYYKLRADREVYKNAAKVVTDLIANADEIQKETGKAMVALDQIQREKHIRTYGTDEQKAALDLKIKEREKENKKKRGKDRVKVLAQEDYLPRVYSLYDKEGIDKTRIIIVAQQPQNKTERYADKTTPPKVMPKLDGQKVSRATTPNVPLMRGTLAAAANMELATVANSSNSVITVATNQSNTPKNGMDGTNTAFFSAIPSLAMKFTGR